MGGEGDGGRGGARLGFDGVEEVWVERAFGFDEGSVGVVKPVLRDEDVDLVTIFGVVEWFGGGGGGKDNLETVGESVDVGFRAGVVVAGGGEMGKGVDVKGKGGFAGLVVGKSLLEHLEDEGGGGDWVVGGEGGGTMVSSQR